jgi:hypothetical protein
VALLVSNLPAGNPDGTPPGTLRPCDGSGTHGWIEPDVWLTTDPRRAAWSCPNCPLMWRLGKQASP